MIRRVVVPVLMLVVSGCSLQKSVYWPNVANAPMLREKHSLHASVHGSPIDLQANLAYAPIDHLAIRVQGDAHPGVLVTGDVGVGVFGHVKANAAGASEIRWEVAADIGTGAGNAFTANSSFSLDDEADEGSRVWEKTQYDTTFRRASAQVALSMVRPKYTFIGVLRTTRIQGDIKETRQRKVSGSGLVKEESTVDIDWHATLEPIGILRAKMGRDIYGEIQMGTSRPTGRHADEFDNNGLLWPFVLAVGFGANF